MAVRRGEGRIAVIVFRQPVDLGVAHHRNGDRVGRHLAVVAEHHRRRLGGVAACAAFGLQGDGRKARQRAVHAHHAVEDQLHALRQGPVDAEGSAVPAPGKVAPVGREAVNAPAVNVGGELPAQAGVGVAVFRAVGVEEAEDPGARGAVEDIQPFAGRHLTGDVRKVARGGVHDAEIADARLQRRDDDMALAPAAGEAGGVVIKLGQALLHGPEAGAVVGVCACQLRLRDLRHQDMALIRVGGGVAQGQAQGHPLGDGQALGNGEQRGMGRHGLGDVVGGIVLLPLPHLDEIPVIDLLILVGAAEDLDAQRGRAVTERTEILIRQLQRAGDASAEARADRADVQDAAAEVGTAGLQAHRRLPAHRQRTGREIHHPVMHRAVRQPDAGVIADLDPDVLGVFVAPVFNGEVHVEGRAAGGVRHGCELDAAAAEAQLRHAFDGRQPLQRRGEGLCVALRRCADAQVQLRPRRQGEGQRKLAV